MTLLPSLSVINLHSSIFQENLVIVLMDISYQLSQKRLKIDIIAITIKTTKSWPMECSKLHHHLIYTSCYLSLPNVPAATTIAMPPLAPPSQSPKRHHYNTNAVKKFSRISHLVKSVAFICPISFQIHSLAHIRERSNIEVPGLLFILFYFQLAVQETR